MDNDGFNQLTLAAGVPWRDRDRAARLLPLPAADRPAVQPGLHRAGAGRTMPRIARACSRTCSRRASIRRCAGRAARRTAAARRSGSAPALEAVTRSDEDRILRALWNALRRRCAPTATRPAAAGQPKDYLSFKIESQMLRELPLPRPLFEVFVYSTAHGGRAPAHGPRGARRHPLVRPARGLPHRGARPDEGAERQEHGHRAGGRQGRLRGAAPAGGDAARRSRPR